LSAHARVPLSQIALGILLACALNVTGARAAPAQAGPKNLGPPNYSGYCQHLGFVDARLTPQPNQQWACLHADSSTSPLDVQAACEFTYAQRPVLAEQLTPGVAFTWQCFQTSAMPGAGPVVGGSGPKQAPTAAQLTASLLSALTPVGRAAKIGALLRAGGYSARFRALAAGTVTISWYFVPRGARLAKARPKPTLVATASAHLSTPRTFSIRVRLTPRGRQLLRHASRLRIAAKGSFTEPAGRPVAARVTFMLKR
jgi:hypothetical protein